MSTCRSQMGSSTGCAWRTSLSKRSLPTSNEVSAAAQPMPQSRSGSGIEGIGDEDSATGIAEGVGVG